MKFLTTSEIREQLDKKEGPDKIELIRSYLVLGNLMSQLSNEDQELVTSMWADDRLNYKTLNKEDVQTDPDLQELLKHLSEEDRCLIISIWKDGILNREEMWALLRLRG